MVNMNEFVRLLNRVIERFSLTQQAPGRSKPMDGTRVGAADKPERAIDTVFVALRIFVVLTLLTGVLYPAAITAVAQLAFRDLANGSLVSAKQQIVGSSLIGQAMHEGQYFWPRPSAVEYMAGSDTSALGFSGASNFGPTNATLARTVRARDEMFRTANGLTASTVVPPDMLFASGSGLDPHISPDAARLQVNRVAVARGLPPAAVALLVEEHVEGPQWGLFGAPRVNVLKLNLALDALQ